MCALKNFPKTFWLPSEVLCTHTHGRDLEREDKSTLFQTVIEASDGHVSVVCYEPNDPPIDTIDRLELYKQKARAARKRSGRNVRQYHLFGVTDDNIDQCREAARDKAVVAFKQYPKDGGASVTTGKVGVVNRSTTIAAMRIARDANKVFQVHPEDPAVIRAEGGKHSIRAESAYIEKMIDCAKEFPGLDMVLSHITCREGMEKIIAAWNSGIKVYAGITPHHLMFTEDGDGWNKDLDPRYYHCYNPLRSKDERDYLRTMIGKPWVVSESDHAPHTKAQKLAGAAGIPTIKHVVPVALTLAVELGITEWELANFLSFIPARIYRIKITRHLWLYNIEEREDDSTYNNGQVENPFRGTKLLFPRLSCYEPV